MTSGIVVILTKINEMYSRKYRNEKWVSKQGNMDDFYNKQRQQQKRKCEEMNTNWDASQQGKSESQLILL